MVEEAAGYGGGVSGEVLAVVGLMRERARRGDPLFEDNVRIAVKIMMVGIIALIAWRTAARRKRVAATSA